MVWKPKPIPAYCGGGSNLPTSLWCAGSDTSRILMPLDENPPYPRVPPSSIFLGTYTGPCRPATGVCNGATLGGTSLEMAHFSYSASSPLRDPGIHQCETCLTLSGSEQSTIMLPLTSTRV